MLDVKFVRENLDDVVKAMEARNFEFDKAAFKKLDENRRKFIAQEEELQANRNAQSKSIGALMSQGKKDEAEKAKEEVRKINEKLEDISAKREKVEEDLKNLMMSVPNIPHESIPVGADENDNPEIRKWGEPTKFNFEPKAH